MGGPTADIGEQLEISNIATFSERVKVLPTYLVCIHKLVPSEYSLCAGERVAWMDKAVETETVVRIREQKGGGNVAVRQQGRIVERM